MDTSLFRASLRTDPLSRCAALSLPKDAIAILPFYQTQAEPIAQSPGLAPGFGRGGYIALNRSDYPVIQGVVLCIAGVYMLINLAVDLSYLAFDPRVRYQ